MVMVRFEESIGMGVKSRVSIMIESFFIKVVNLLGVCGLEGKVDVIFD